MNWGATVAALLIGFSAARADEKPVRIAFSSCIQAPDRVSWGALYDKNPDALLLLGDNIYLRAEDFGELERIRARYHELTSQSGFKRLLSMIPILATWDDHDFGPNNSDSTYKHRQESFTAFKEVWKPKPVSGLEESVAQEATIGNVQILLLDGRTYRRYPEPGANPVMFGEKQMQWIEERLRTTNSPFVIIGSGGQFLCDADRDECFGSFPKERGRLLKAAHGSPAKVVFLSGDRHYSEILRMPVGDKIFFEGSVSPLAGGFRTPEKAGIEPARKVLITEENAFGVLSLYSEPSRSALFEIFRASGELLVRVKDKKEQYSE